MSQTLSAKIKVPYEYKVHFSKNLFNINNRTLINVLKNVQPQSFLVLIEKKVYLLHEKLEESIRKYFEITLKTSLPKEHIQVHTGSEECKNSDTILNNILKHIDKLKICRHSIIITIGGGAFLDCCSYAASIAHRGIPCIRIPTTVLSQNDSGLGVKNGINIFNKKNFIGCFQPPFAVLNDSAFLKTLDTRNWLSGCAEAIKVSLFKDANFFNFLCENGKKISEGNSVLMEDLIYTCAKLHLEHITESQDPFERTSSRPLDFGHWFAHKLESVSNYKILHGEAVAIGIGIDSYYSFKKGLCTESINHQVQQCLKNFNFPLSIKEYQIQLDKDLIQTALNEFREHIGGTMCIPLLKEPGYCIEVDNIDLSLMYASINDFFSKV